MRGGWHEQTVIYTLDVAGVDPYCTSMNTYVHRQKGVWTYSNVQNMIVKIKFWK